MAGGTATRLFPLTATISKQLLPVYDRQMIFYPLNTLIRAGIKDILVIVSPEHGGHFLNLLGSIFKRYGIQLYFEIQRVPRGLPEAFILGEKFLDGDSAALVLGDNIFEDDFSPLIKNFRSGGHIFVTTVSDPERFGVIKLNRRGEPVKIVEKPLTRISDLAISGLYLYDNRVIEAAKRLKPSARGEMEIVDLHNFYLRKKELQVTIFNGIWLDAGTFDSLLEAGRVVKERGIHKKFDPLIDAAIVDFNAGMKDICRKKLF